MKVRDPRLAQNPPMDPVTAQPDNEYEAGRKRMQTDIADWRLSVDLKRAWLDLDVGAQETCIEGFGQPRCIRDVATSFAIVDMLV